MVADQRLTHTAQQRYPDGLTDDGSGCPSIMTAAFPCKVALAGLRDEEEAEQDMTTLLAVAKAARGLQMLQAKLISKPAEGEQVH